MAIAIDPKTVRYKIAQFFLSLLYGRKWHYISPWKHASVASTVVLVKDNKVLMGKRRGDIEYIGCRDNPGGHVTLEENEGLVEACIREVYEEMNLRLDADKFQLSSVTDIWLNHEAEYIEEKDACNICITYRYDISEEELEDLKESGETYDYKWFDEAGLLKELEKDMVPFEQNQFERALKALRFSS